MRSGRCPCHLRPHVLLTVFSGTKNSKPMIPNITFNELGKSSTESLAQYFASASDPWKIAYSPYSKRLTLPLLWCHSELINGRIKCMHIQQSQELSNYTRLALVDLTTHMPGIPIRVFYAKLLGGDSIAAHIDDGSIFAISHRCHLPIIAPDGIQFTCSQDTYTPKKGQWFEVNNCLIHSVINSALTERIHLIVDILPEEHIRLLEAC